MIDTEKVKWFRWVIIALGFILIFVLGFGLGQVGKSVFTPNQARSSLDKRKVKNQSLTREDVKSFLTAYYTKKDLGTNRNRYKPFMTEGLYNATISEEDNAQNQAYKGYVVNYDYKNSDIYIDQPHKQVICKVTYTNDLLQKKNKTAGSQKGVVNHATIQLTYVKVKGEYLVDRMSTLLIIASDNPKSSNEAYGTMTTSETE